MFEFPCIISLYYIKNQQDATLAVSFISNCKITLHDSLVIVQLDAQILFNVFIYLFIVLYMFRACHAHHQEKQIVSIQLLVIVTPCW